MNRKFTGFTLMETTLALALLTVGMLGLAGVYSQIVRSSTVSKQKRIAALLGEAKLAQFRTLPLTGMAELKGAFGAPFQHYTWQAQFDYQSDDSKVADIWLEVKHKSNTSVKLWTRVAIKDAQL